MAIEPGLQAALVHTVGNDDTASAMGSGDVAVLATPRLLALCEAATVAALAESRLGDDRTTVGTHVELDHLAPTAVGETVTVSARLVEVDGRTLRFEVVVTDDADQMVGRAIVSRVVVDRERFLSRSR